MKAILPLSQMTIAEKLRPMEAQFKSPAWHGEVLHNRDEKIKSGKESFMDWEAAKKQLRKTFLEFGQFVSVLSVLIRVIRG